MDRSEVEAESELHSAVGGQHATVGAESSARQVTDEVERILGRQPISLSQWAKENAGAFLN